MEILMEILGIIMVIFLLLQISHIANVHPVRSVGNLVMQHWIATTGWTIRIRENNLQLSWQPWAQLQMLNILISPTGFQIQVQQITSL